MTMAAIIPPEMANAVIKELPPPQLRPLRPFLQRQNGVVWFNVALRQGAADTVQLVFTHTPASGPLQSSGQGSGEKATDEAMLQVWIGARQTAVVETQPPATVSVHQTQERPKTNPSEQLPQSASCPQVGMLSGGGEARGVATSHASPLNVEIGSLAEHTQLPATQLPLPEQKLPSL